MGQKATIIGAKTARRWAIDSAMLVGMGVLMGFLGPFDSNEAAVETRYLYWTICMVGGGLIAFAVDDGLNWRIRSMGVRLAVASALATPLVTLFVLTTQFVMFNQGFHWIIYGQLLWQVFPIMLAAITVRALVWRRSPTRIETRTVIAPPLPEAEAAFRRRLSAKRRGARLIAVEAHDHYLKVHTDAGAELITLRFADALSELALAHGWRIHRSWWVAADAVQSIRWRRGVGELHLLCDLKAPVSRTYAGILKEAGWS